MLLIVTFIGLPPCDKLNIILTLYQQTNPLMKKILTLTIAIIFAANFANAATLTNGNKTGKTKAAKTTSVKFVRLTKKDFCIKKMQDTKDILLQLPASSQTRSNG